MSDLLQQDIITGVRFSGVFNMFVIAFAMAIVCREKVQSKVYNASRWLLIAGTLLLGVHNLIQFVGHFREESVCLSWVFNVVFYAFTASFYGMAEMNLLRAGHKMQRFLWVNISGLFLICLLLGVGYFTDTLINDRAPWLTTTFAMAVIYTVLLIYMNVTVVRELSASEMRLTDDELQERHRVLRYTARCMHYIIIVSLITPWAGMSSSLILNAIMGCVVFALFVWYLVAFVVYGRDMQEVIDVEDEIYVANISGESEGKENCAPDSRVAVAVEAWVADRRYLDSNLTIKKALDDMGIGVMELNFYLLSQYDIAGYRQWLPYLRIEEAKRLMTEHPNYNLDAIADMCGLSNGSALARTFRAQTGMTPTQWVKKQKEI